MNTTQKIQRLVTGTLIVLAVGGLAACAGRSVDGDGAGAAREVAQSRALERSAAQTYVDQLEARSPGRAAAVSRHQAEAYVDQLEARSAAHAGSNIARLQADAYVALLEARAHVADALPPTAPR